MPHPKLIIFDFDGTLADSLPWFLGVFDETADKFGFKRMDRANKDLLRGLDARQIMSHHDIPLWKVPAISLFMHKTMERDSHLVGLFDGIDHVLRQLAADGVILALVTSNARTNVLRILGPELAALFTYLECGAALFGKLAKVRKVIKKSGFPLSEVMMIGDEIRDAKAAMQAGVAFGAVAWGYNHLDALLSQSPQKVFHHVAQLRPH